ncbi:MAG: O-antigen ligase family protein [Gemmatimonadaceae bacterium]
MNPLVAATALSLLAVLAGNLLRLPVLSAGSKAAALLPVDLLVATILALGVLNALRARRWRIDRAMQWGVAFVLVAVIGVSTAPWRVGLSLRDVLFGGAYLVRWASYLGVGLVLGSSLRARESLHVVRLFGVMVLVFAAFGIVQSLFIPGFAQRVYPEAAVYLDWDPQGSRLVSTFLDPNYAGILIVMGLCWWVGRLIAGAKAPLWEGAVLGAALLLTLSRGAMVAFACALVTLLLARGVSRRALRASLAAVGMLAVASPLLIRYAAPYGKLIVDASALQRLVSWQRAWTMLADYPWLGIGFNNTGFLQARYGWAVVGNASFGLDGGLLFIAALTGILGLGCFVMMLVSLVRSARTLWRSERSADERAVGYAAAASVVAVTVHATFANTLLLALVLVPAWILWSAPLSLPAADER